MLKISFIRQARQSGGSDDLFRPKAPRQSGPTIQSIDCPGPRNGPKPSFVKQLPFLPSSGAILKLYDDSPLGGMGENTPALLNTV